MTEALSRLQPEGTQSRLRVTLSAPEHDTLISRLSKPSARPTLPQYLFLYSQQVYDVTVPGLDADKQAQRRSQLMGYRTRLEMYKRNRFELNDDVEFLGMGGGYGQFSIGLRLGIQEARTIAAPPFFEEMPHGAIEIPFIYEAPQPVADFRSRVERLQRELSTAARVDELVLVDAKTWLRPVAVRPQRPREIHNETVATIDLSRQATMERLKALKDSLPEAG